MAVVVRHGYRCRFPSVAQPLLLFLSAQASRDADVSLTRLTAEQQAQLLQLQEENTTLK